MTYPASIYNATRRPVVITALDVAQVRTNWPENFTFPVSGTTVPPFVRDNSPSGTTVAERRHEVWLDAGTWQGYLGHQRNTSQGTCELLIDNVTAGTINTAGTANDLYAAFPTSLVIAQPGPHMVTIRKTTASGLVSFVDLILRRTA